MTDTLWPDISKFQGHHTNFLREFPKEYRGLAFRSNDGTYRDPEFTSYLAQCKHAMDTGRFDFFIVYFVWEPNWRATIATFKAMVGAPHRGMVVMIDTESWGGRITGDHSASLNETRKELVHWFESFKPRWARVLHLITRRAWRRVIGYGNAGDLANLWPHRGRIGIVLANYSTNPDFPHKIAHQFSDHYGPVPPFGYVDMNSADGYTVTRLAARLGVARMSKRQRKALAEAKRKHGN